MDRCVKPYEAVNHPPIARLNGDATQRVLSVVATPGSEVPLCADGSNDPDGDRLSCLWWVYREAGTYSGTPSIMDPNAVSTSLTVPVDAAGMTIHVILEMTDDGIPSLTSYRRLIVQVAGNEAGGSYE